MPDRHYESSDANSRGVWSFAVGMTISVVVICFTIGGMMWLLRDGSPEFASRDSGPGIPPPAPALQVSTRADMDAYRSKENALLESYGWIDRDAEVVRIPIERAMELIAERGIPASQSRITPAEMRQQKAQQP